MYNKRKCLFTQILFIWKNAFCFFCYTWFCSILSPEPRHSTSDRLQADSIGISPSPGTPPTALSLRKYHYHRYLSSLFRRTAPESFPRGKAPPLGASPGKRCSPAMPAITATYLPEVYSVVNEHGRLFFWYPLTNHLFWGHFTSIFRVFPRKKPCKLFMNAFEALFGDFRAFIIPLH